MTADRQTSVDAGLRVAELGAVLVLTIDRRRGLVAAAGALLRLPERIPANLAMELALVGGTLSAQDAYRHGLVNRLSAPGGACDVAIELAGQIAANGPLAVRASKRILREARDWPSAEAFARQAPISEPVFASSDAVEGARAFAERREPQWSGR